MSIRNLKLFIGAALGLAALILSVIFLFSGNGSMLSNLRERKLIDTSHAINEYLFEYVGKELPPSVRSLIALPANDSNGATLYIIINDDPKKTKLQPLNAMYDPKQDCIYIDRKLIITSMKTRTPGVRSFLAYVLLHELGHRTLHRGGNVNYDAIGVKRLDRRDKRGKEKEADAWATDRYLELMPIDSAGVFIFEPNSLPLLNLMEGGFLTTISQYGPYSPILQGPEHPSIYSRLLNFFLALANAKRLRPANGIFYAMEALKLQQFLSLLDGHLQQLIVIEEGDLPLSGALQNDTLWIKSYKNRLYAAPLTFSSTIVESHALIIYEHLPDEMSGLSLQSIDGVLLLAGEHSKTIYYYDRPLKKWKTFIDAPGDENYISKGKLYSWKYDEVTKGMKIYSLNAAARSFVLSGSFDCTAAIGIDDFKIKMCGNKVMLFIQNDVGQLDIYRLKSGRTEKLAHFDNCNEYAIDDQLRFLEINRNVSGLRDSVYTSFYEDAFGRPYLVDTSKDGLFLKGYGPFIGSVNIFDLDKGAYTVRDLFLQQDTNDKSTDAGKYFLYSGFFTVLKEDGSILLTDDLLRNGSVVVNDKTRSGKSLVVTDIPYSRYLLVLDFETSKKAVVSEPIQLHAIDL